MDMRFVPWVDMEMIRSLAKRIHRQARVKATTYDDPHHPPRDYRITVKVKKVVLAESYSSNYQDFLKVRTDVLNQLQKILSDQIASAVPKPI